MSINKELQYKSIMRTYDDKRRIKQHEKEERERFIYNKIPDIEKIDKNLSMLGVKLVRMAVSNASEEQIKEVKDKQEFLMQTKKQLLEAAGYAPNFLDTWYECERCKDTGYIHNVSIGEKGEDIAHSEICDCLNAALKEAAYKQSSINRFSKNYTFSNFRIEYYSTDAVEGRKLSSRDNMKRIFTRVINFIEGFEKNKGNILFYGSTGLGKTFLCNCIGRELLNQGYSVIYLTAHEWFTLLEENRFHRDELEDTQKDSIKMLLEADLLIIDDLGTEPENIYTGPELFNLVNTRLINNLSTIISTNAPMSIIGDRYSIRTLSRIYGEYELCEFYGKDIRIAKKEGSL